MALEAVMREVERTADQWAHVHEWFHAERSNARCPWCQLRAAV